MRNYKKLDTNKKQLSFLLIYEMPTYNRKNEISKFRELVKGHQKGEVVYYHHYASQQYTACKKGEWNEEMRRFRKERKEGIKNIDPINHRNPTIKGKQFYTFVLQNTDMDTNPTFDPLGMAFDDGFFVVSGFIYSFRNEANRDASYKYIMGLK